MARLFRIITVQENKTISDNSGFPVYDVKHIWWDYLIVNSWDLQMNNRWCLLKRVPLCLPSLLKEFQIVSAGTFPLGSHTGKSFSKLAAHPLCRPGVAHIIHHHKIDFVFFPPLCYNIKAVTCCPEFLFLNQSWISLYNKTCLLCSRLLL